jgi:hypothetical protein
MKTLLLLLIFLQNTAFALTVTNLNIEWFGRGGIKEGTTVDEYRGKRLHDLITNQIPKSDVLVFQEITAPELLQATFPKWQCESYETTARRHQHVMICVRPEAFISKDVDYQVQLGSFGLRAAMIVNVKYGENKKLSIVGVHLKAGPNDTGRRLEQVKKLADSTKISQQALIIGDFNTFTKDRTGLAKDDDQLMADLLSPIGFKQVEFEGNTYISRYPKKLDRAWLRGELVPTAQVYGPCREKSAPWPYANYSFYKRFISDHCIVQVKLIHDPFAK